MKAFLIYEIVGCFILLAIFSIVGAQSRGQSIPPTTEPAKLKALEIQDALQIGIISARQRIDKSVIFTAIERIDGMWVLTCHMPGAEKEFGGNNSVWIHDDASIEVVRGK